MTQKTRKRFDPAFKARVALEAMQERETLAQIGKKYGIHPVMVGQWKARLMERAAGAFKPGGSRPGRGEGPRRVAEEGG